MKKVVFVLCIVLVFVLGGSLVTLADEPVEEAMGEEAEATTETEAETEADDFVTIWNEQIFPALLTVLSSVGTILLIISPIMSKVGKESGNLSSLFLAFKNESDAMEKMKEQLIQFSEAQNGEYKDTIEKMQKTVDTYKEALQQTQDVLMEVLEKVDKQSGATVQMLKLGLGNTKELVQKGVASSICLIGEGVQANEETNEDSNA